MNNIKRISIHIRGITPLIMHCDTLCNPLHPLKKKMSEITAIKKKHDEHHIAMSKIEFEAGMYFNDDIGIYMPSRNLQGCLKAAAKKYKKGKQTKAVVMDEAIGYPLLPYAGKTIDDLYTDTNKKGDRPYVFIQSINVDMKKIMRTRPIFHKWEVKFGLYLDPELLPVTDLKMITETAGYEFGLCEMRPQLATGNYGKFEIVDFKEVK